jgi:hypothetical protein
MTNTNTSACPDCRGEGTVYDQVQWSDGLGGVTATCTLCDGTGKIDILANLRKYKRQALESGKALAQLQRHVLCYLDTSDPLRDGNVRGIPGASPHADTWHAYLKTVANVTAERLTIECVEMERRDHAEGHHTKPVPKWPCALTNSRAYCLECNPQPPQLTNAPDQPRRPLRR